MKRQFNFHWKLRH